MRYKGSIARDVIRDQRGVPWDSHTFFSSYQYFPQHPVILKNNRHSRRSFLCLTLLKAFHDLYDKIYSLSQAHKALHNLASVYFFSLICQLLYPFPHPVTGSFFGSASSVPIPTLYSMPGELSSMFLTEGDHHGSVCFISPFPSQRGLQLPDRNWPTVKLSFNTLFVSFIEFTTNRS